MHHNQAGSWGGALDPPAARVLPLGPLPRLGLQNLTHLPCECVVSCRAPPGPAAAPAAGSASHSGRMPPPNARVPPAATGGAVALPAGAIAPPAAAAAEEEWSPWTAVAAAVTPGVPGGGLLPGAALSPASLCSHVANRIPPDQAANHQAGNHQAGNGVELVEAPPPPLPALSRKRKRGERKSHVAPRSQQQEEDGGS